MNKKAFLGQLISLKEKGTIESDVSKKKKNYGYMPISCS